MPKIPVFYRPEQSADQGTEQYSPSSGKPAMVVRDWLKHFGDRIEIAHFSQASHHHLYRAHDPRYVDAILKGEQRNGFGNCDPVIAESLRFTVGSMIGACKHVLSDSVWSNSRVAVSPTSGFHHAGYDFAGGFCTFNGLLAAAIEVYTLGLAERILILDMDFHGGNGTQDIINRLDIDYVDHFSSGLGWGGATAEETLTATGRLRRELATGYKRKYDLVIYQAGADMHINDPLGGLLTTSEMMQRDVDVFAACIKTGTPVVWNLAGGYQRDANGGIEVVLKLHRQTMEVCCRIFNPINSGMEDE
jgi:acetoin utilization deacetylase AcuC-like enzyme